MTKNGSRLHIRRLLVTKSGRSVYDQDFHKGINVIRGEHSVGKTTVLDFIFHVLGGEIKEDQWLYPANICDEVICEVGINDKFFCLKREISPGKVPSIYIYSGIYADAENDLTGWVRYGARRNDNKYSFSQQIFELLGWEHHKTDEYANLTLHQILRLLYLDQQTSLIKIFRHESNQADSETMRKAISEFLLGLDNLDSHKARQDLLRAEKRFYKAKEELDAIFKVLGRDSAYRTEDLEREIVKLHDDIAGLNREKVSVLTTHETEEGTPKTDNEANIISLQIDKLATRVTSLKSNLTEISNEIADSVEFGKSIAFRKKALLESKDAYESFGMVEFKYCPSCQAPLDQPVEDDVCPLCKSEKPHAHLSESYLEILTELQFQEKQNNITMFNLDKKHKEVSTELLAASKNIESKKQELRHLINYTSDREEALTKISKEIGFIESQIETLLEKSDIVQQVDRLRDDKADLNKLIVNLTDELAVLEKRNLKRRHKVMENLSITIQYILEQDLDYEKTFSEASNYQVEVDFPKDRWLLDGRSRFSDSSNVIKKSALHLACLIESIKDNKFRFPAFLIMDFEGGGIKPERSKNLQKIILSMLNDVGGDYQLILSTAMVDESLNTDAYGIGPYYNKGEYVIKLS